MNIIVIFLNYFKTCDLTLKTVNLTNNRLQFWCHGSHDTSWKCNRSSHRLFLSGECLTVLTVIFNETE